MKEHTHAFLFFLGGLFLMLVGPSLIPFSSAATIAQTFVDTQGNENVLMDATASYKLQGKLYPYDTDTQKVSVEWTTTKGNTYQSDLSKYVKGSSEFIMNFGKNGFKLYETNGVNTFIVKSKDAKGNSIGTQKVNIYVGTDGLIVFNEAKVSASCNPACENGEWCDGNTHTCQHVLSTTTKTVQKIDETSSFTKVINDQEKVVFINNTNGIPSSFKLRPRDKESNYINVESNIGGNYRLGPRDAGYNYTNVESDSISSNYKLGPRDTGHNYVNIIFDDKNYDSSKTVNYQILTFVGNDGKVKNKVTLFIVSDTAAYKTLQKTNITDNIINNLINVASEKSHSAGYTTEFTGEKNDFIATVGYATEFTGEKSDFITIDSALRTAGYATEFTGEKSDLLGAVSYFKTFFNIALKTIQNNIYQLVTYLNYMKINIDAINQRLDLTDTFLKSQLTTSQKADFEAKAKVINEKLIKDEGKLINSEYY